MHKLTIIVAIAVIATAAATLTDPDTIVNVVSIPSGAPPTNDGYAYSQLSYNKNWLYIAGQNGYDSCGNLVPLDVINGTTHIYTRTYITFLSIKAIMECFNMPLTQIPSTTVVLSPLLVSAGYTPAQINDLLLMWRSEVNTIQRLPEFWGPTAALPARAIIGAQWLSRGDVVEIEPKPIPRINNLRRTCLQTGITPPAAATLLRWTVNGTVPTTAIPLLPLGTGPCN